MSSSTRSCWSTTRSPTPRNGYAEGRLARPQRTRKIRWGPRTLDVDVIDVELTRRQDPQLTLPHPRAHQRAFVLVPWLDVAPDAVLAGRGRVADLVAALPAAERRSVRRRDDLVLRRL
jgi:2-amino-4-hydroxy-6-hydroxymethyldihydropteridine diphosphokinase